MTPRDHSVQPYEKKNDRLQRSILSNSVLLILTTSTHEKTHVADPVDVDLQLGISGMHVPAAKPPPPPTLSRFMFEAPRKTLQSKKKRRLFF